MWGARHLFLLFKVQSARPPTACALPLQIKGTSARPTGSSHKSYMISCAPAMRSVRIPLPTVIVPLPVPHGTAREEAVHSGSNSPSAARPCRVALLLFPSRVAARVNYMRSSVVFRLTVAEEANGYFGDPEVFDFSVASRVQFSQ